MPPLCQWFRMFVYLLVGIISKSECLYPTLGMFFARLVVPPPPFYLGVVDRPFSGFLMAVVVERVYG